MSAFSAYFHKRLALADLGTGNCRGLDLDDDLIRAALTGAGADGSGLAGALSDLYPSALVLAAGPLGGSFAPASGLLTLVARHNGRRDLAFVPQGHGAWLRASGLDALVITGVASRPALLRVSGGACRVEALPVSESAPDRNLLRNALLRRTETGQAALLLADCGVDRHQRPVSAAGLENGPMEGGAVAGAALDYRNLAALLLEGRGPLPPVPLPLRNEARIATTAREPAWPKELALHGVAGLPRKIRWKSAACLHCPAPCLAWVRTGEDQWLLCGDHAGFAAALQACGERAPACLALCDGLGLDLATYAPLLAGTAPEDMREVLLSATASQDHPLPGPPETPPATPPERAGAVLGLCPKLIRRYPALTTDMLAGLLEGDVRSLPRPD